MACVKSALYLTQLSLCKLVSDYLNNDIHHRIWKGVESLNIKPYTLLLTAFSTETSGMSSSVMMSICRNSPSEIITAGCGTAVARELLFTPVTEVPSSSIAIENCLCHNCHLFLYQVLFYWFKGPPKLTIFLLYQIRVFSQLVQITQR